LHQQKGHKVRATENEAEQKEQDVASKLMQDMSEDLNEGDKEKLKQMIDYDIVPEMEQHLHSVVKRLHQSMDELPDSDTLDKEIPSGEENKDDDDDLDIV